jgi:cytochrome c-type biogenesis protein CcsB
MAELSNQLLPVAVLLYLAAMMCYLAEYSFGRQGAVARTAARPTRALVSQGAAAGTPARELIGAGGPPVDAPVSPAVVAVPAVPSSGSTRAELFGRVAVWVTVLAALAHAGVLVTRGIAAGRVPWGNMYEFVIALSLVGAVTWLVLLVRRPSLRLLGLFVTIALVLILGFAGMVLYTKVEPLVPALNSYWLKIHVSAAALASGLLLTAFVPAAQFLVRAGYDQGNRRFPYTIGRRLPAADTLERLSFRLHAFAFPIWTFAIICGAIWAESAWGRYWGWDPKEVWSFISWVAYAAYLHARATPAVKKTTATWFAVAAWGTMLINLYVINFVAVGLHSYAHVGS